MPNVVVHFHCDARDQRANARIGDFVRGETGQADGALEQGHGQAVVQAELALQRRVGHDMDQGREGHLANPRPNGLDRLPANFRMQLQRCFNARVGGAAGWEGLEREAMLGEDLQPLPHGQQRCGVMADAGVEHGEVAVAMLHHHRARIVPGLGQQGRLQASARSQARMQGLDHAAEVGAQPAGRRRGDAQRGDHLRGAQAQHPAAGHRRGQRSEGAGGMPAPLVVLRVERPPELAEDLKAGDVGVDHLRAGGLAARRNRQQRRHDHRAGVGIGRVVGVVVVQRMGDGAVVKGGVALGSVATRANQKGRCL